MTNTIGTVKANATKIVKMAAADLADSVQFFKSARKMDKAEFKPDAGGHSPGDTVNVRIPSKYTVGTTSFDLTSAIQGHKEQYKSMTLDIIATVGTELTSQELAHDVDLGSVYDRFVRPQIMDIAASVEHQMIKKATQLTYNIVGTAGSTVYDTDTVLAAREKMSKFLCPKDQYRYLLFDSTAMRSAVNARKGLFNSQQDLAKTYKSGAVGEADGFKWLENELLYKHTNGADVAMAVEDTVVTIAEGMSTLGVDGVTANATVKKGSTFTIAGVYAVHPQTKEAYDFLQTFTVTADVTEKGSAGSVTLAISPAIYSSASGSLQNVSALPADEAVVTFTGAASTSYVNSLAFHKEAFRVTSVPLVLPISAEFAAQATEDGITVAIVRDFDVYTRKMITRVDFLGGLVDVRPEWACRIIS